jgi:hypothetical protein
MNQNDLIDAVYHAYSSVDRRFKGEDIDLNEFLVSPVTTLAVASLRRPFELGRVGAWRVKRNVS